MFKHLTLKELDHFRLFDSIFTTLSMVVILSLAFIAVILMAL